MSELESELESDVSLRQVHRKFNAFFTLSRGKDQIKLLLSRSLLFNVNALLRVAHTNGCDSLMFAVYLSLMVHSNRYTRVG